MKHRHKMHEEMKRAEGGRAVAYAGGDSNVMKEAHERKRGGKVKHEGEGEKAKERADKPKRAAGGSVKRAQGGAIGANKRPLSTAATIKEVTKGEHAEDMGKH